MNYKQLTKEKKAQIDILLKQGLSMRKTAKILENTLYVSSKISKMYSLKLKIFQKLCNFFNIILLIMLFNIKRLI